MVITTHELTPSDVPHLHCTDPDLAAEMAAINRSLDRLDETVATWLYLDPQETLARREVIA